MTTTRSDTANPVVIQDIVVAGFKNNNPPPNHPTGEFGHPEKFGGFILVPETPDNLLSRLFSQVQSLASQASASHIASHCNPGTSQPAPGKEHTITRMLTNEFFFYTKQPLTIEQFEKLMQQIETMAGDMPKNLHLVLGSFAVKTPDNKVMNVVPVIECGMPPNVKLVVKNNPSSIDPVYNERDQQGNIIVLPNIDIQKKDEVSQYAITLSHSRCGFSFDNVFLSQTLGGGQFHCCVDICLDHGMGVGKKRIDSKLAAVDQSAEQGIAGQKIPLQCAHAVLSNWIPLYSQYCIGDMTHADPEMSHTKCKADVKPVSQQSFQVSTFGTSAEMIVMPPTHCKQLSRYELAMVKYYNQIQDFISAYRGPPAQLQAAIAMQFAPQKAMLDMEKLAEASAAKYGSYDLALQFAVVNNDLKLVKFFLDNKFNPNMAATQTGDTLLAFAASYQHVAMVKLLLQYKADPNLPNFAGKTPHQYAEGTGNTELIGLLRPTAVVAPPRPSKPAPEIEIDPHLLKTIAPEAHPFRSVHAPPNPKSPLPETSKNLPPERPKVAAPETPKSLPPERPKVATPETPKNLSPKRPKDAPPEITAKETKPVLPERRKGGILSVTSAAPSSSSMIMDKLAKAGPAAPRNQPPPPPLVSAFNNKVEEVMANLAQEKHGLAVKIQLSALYDELTTNPGKLDGNLKGALMKLCEPYKDALFEAHNPGKDTEVLKCREQIQKIWSDYNAGKTPEIPRTAEPFADHEEEKSRTFRR